MDSSPSRASVPRLRSFLLITAAYVVAFVVAAIVVTAAPKLGVAAEPLHVAALADLAATLVVFAASFALDNSSVYDPYWSVAPMALAPWLAAQPSAAGAPLGRQILVIGLVTFWGLRLTYNRKTGRAYWLVSLTGIHLMPTVMVYLGCLALSPALTSPRPLGPLDALAAAVTLAAVLIELTADEQLLHPVG